MFRLQYFDHYRLLDIEESASRIEIRRAYDRAVAKYNNGRRSVRFQLEIQGRTPDRLRSAFEELSDPSQRAKYDAFLQRVRSMQLSLLH